MKDKRKLLKVVGAVLVAILLAVGAMYMFTRSKESTNQQFFSVLTGNEVNETEASRPILGIMVENSPTARPQTGLGTAGIVFETVTEGGITRFLALYQEDVPETVAPVRSLRPAFLDWAMGFDASIAHVGGSAEALDQAAEREAKSLNQFEYQDPYFRTDEREAPHNMSVRVQSLRDLQNELGHELGSVESFLWSEPDEENASEPTATSISVKFSSPTYTAEYSYNAEANSYQRSLAGEPHIDAATNKQIHVTNLIVLEAPGSPVTATGQGKATVFRDGTAIEGRWEKQGYSDRLRFVDADGNEISLNRGNTWIAVLPEDGQLTY